MGNHHTSEVRRTFDELDPKHTGHVCLEELIRSRCNSCSHFDPRICSLTTLYMFDVHKEGTLTYKEFAELDRLVQKIVKKVEKQQQQQQHHHHINRHLSHSHSQQLNQPQQQPQQQQLNQPQLNQQNQNQNQNPQQQQQQQQQQKKKSKTSTHSVIESMLANMVTLPSPLRRTHSVPSTMHEHMATTASSTNTTTTTTATATTNNNNQNYNHNPSTNGVPHSPQPSSFDTTSESADTITSTSTSTAILTTNENTIRSLSTTSPLPSPCGSNHVSPSHSSENLTSLNRDETRMQTSYQFQSQCSNTSSESDDDEEEFFQQVKDCINAELLPALKRHLSEKKGKEQFLNWLFKVADWKHDGLITLEELDLILRAVQQDGIDLHDLVFDKSDQSGGGAAAPILAQHVMSEYDPSHEGFLTKDEFMTLGEIILNHYEISQQHHHGRIGVWDLTHILGEGSYGTVMCGVNSETGERRAIKAIKRGNVSDMSRLDIEIQAMMMLRHPHVVHLENIIETEDTIFLIMELCGGGSLHENLTDKPLDEDLARYYFNLLLDGLSYCHSQGVCHRDLRLENLLLADDGSLKITDFGQARIFKKGWDLFSTQLVGSLHHLSPEQISGQCYSGEKVDIWSAGVILYCFLTANFPFSNVDVNVMFDCIRHARYELPDILSPDAKDLIQHILQVDPNKRLSLLEIKNHPWTRGNQKQPQLMQYALDLEYKSVIGWLEAKGWETVEKILDTFEIYYLLNDAHSDLSTGTLRNLKCLYPPADLKFSISLMAPDGELGKKIMIQFNLREGETKQFRKLVHRIHKAFRQKFRCVQNELPSLAIPIQNEHSVSPINKHEASVSPSHQNSSSSTLPLSQNC